jgi:hypothetical protein
MLIQFRKKIFFDGYLPPSKRDTRFARIKDYTKQLNEYHQAWPQIIPSMYANDEGPQPVTKLFSFAAVPSNFTKLPAASFLVPAVIESLSRCDRFKDLLEVVPGEADAYCACYVKSHGGAVLTGDSDLLVHDLGTGSVIFFRDIELVDVGNATFLRSIRYDLEAISRRLGLPKSHGLQALAFEMIMDPHGSFRELKQRAVKLQAISSHEKMYEEFNTEYNELIFNFNVQPDHTVDNKLAVSLRSHLMMLDPRISEFVLQFQVFVQASGLPEHPRPRSFDGHDNPEIFLPFLLDCPVRTSAWEMSVLVRLLAYGLINFIVPVGERITSVFEHRRLQNGTQGREWQVSTNEHILVTCTELTNLFRQLRDVSLKPIDQSLWRAVAVYQDLVYSSSNDKPALCNSLMGYPKATTAAQKRLTWDGIHFYAQLQGSYYSFRILKQIIDIVLMCDKAKALPSELYQLQGDLEDLPPLNSLPSVGDGIRALGTPEDQEILATVRKLLDVQDEEVVVKTSRKRDKKKRKANQQKVRAIRQSNVFQVLDTN